MKRFAKIVDDDNGGDDDDDAVFAEWLTDEKHYTLVPAKTTFRNSHHRKSPTRCEQDLNLNRTWV